MSRWPSPATTRARAMPASGSIAMAIRVGGKDVLQWIEQIPFSETKAYVQRVIENSVVYDRMNPGTPAGRSTSPTSSGRAVRAKSSASNSGATAVHYRRRLRQAARRI